MGKQITYFTKNNHIIQNKQTKNTQRRVLQFCKISLRPDLREGSWMFMSAPYLICCLWETPLYTQQRTRDESEKGKSCLQIITEIVFTSQIPNRVSRTPGEPQFSWHSLPPSSTFHCYPQSLCNLLTFQRAHPLTFPAQKPLGL